MKQIDQIDADFPLVALAGRVAYRDVTPGEFVAVSTDDARRLGVADGEIVRIVARCAEALVPAKLGAEVPSGVVFVPAHYSNLTASAHPLFAAVRLEKLVA